MLTTTPADIQKHAEFNLQKLEQTIDEIKQTSFSSLYQFQKELANIKRFDLKMSQLVLMTNIDRKVRQYPKKYIGSVGVDFIHKRKRLAYKRSSFFNKELSVFDVAKNTDIFSYTYMVFVDGKFIDSINILPKEDRTLLVFDIQESMNPVGIPQSHFDSLVAKDANVTVFFIPNAVYGVYNTNRSTLYSYRDKLALSEFNLAGNLTDETTYITFINTQKMIFASVITDTTNSADMLRFKNNAALASTNKQVHLNVFGFRNLHKQLSVLGTDQFFKVTGLNMPVPVENMMVFKDGADGTKTFAHGVSLKQYYPNIYEVIGNTDNSNLTIYVFYSKDNNPAPLKYKNELEAYEKFKGLDLALYKNNTIPTAIRNFTPASFVYGIDDYNKSAQYPDHLAYKLNKLSSWIDANPELLRSYLLKQITTPAGYYLDVSKVDLTSKKRTNNHAEILTVSQQETFAEERYLFILRDEFGTDFQHLRFYIDGNAYVPDKKWKDSTYEYYYIPVSLVKSNSIIEIERFERINFMTEVIFSSTSENEAIKVNKDISRNDIFLIDTNTREFIDKSRYKVSYFNESGIKTDLGTDSFKIIKGGSFIINITDATLAGISIEIHAQRDTYYQFHQITELQEAGSTFTFTQLINPDKRHFRIFRNGRLLSQNLYEIESPKTYGGGVLVTPLVYKEIGDSYIIDYTPNKYKVVYEQPTIPSNGIVNLFGKINKPFDLKWYDMYINGRRMNTTNIEYVSPFIIAIKGVSSLKNLLIVEKDKDPDFIKPSSTAKTFTDVLWDTMPDFQTSIGAGRPILPDTEPDVVTEIITELSLEMKRFYDNVMVNFTFLNPDVLQLTDEDKTNNPSMFTGNVALLNPDKDFNPRSYIMKVYAE